MPKAQATEVLALVDKLEQEDDVHSVFHNLGVSFGTLQSGHGHHLAHQRILESKAGHVLDPLRKQNAVQMVDFMLHDAGMEALHGALEELSLSVQAAVVQAPVARHHAAQTRHGQTAFPALFHFRAQAAQALGLMSTVKGIGATCG